ncbi:MAG TPA: hypothetical protein DEQ02_00495 [Ruminococcaceae bacterium]|nr:hypothetical protein [Oscillospiraceae bacterium]
MFKGIPHTCLKLHKKEESNFELISTKANPPVSDDAALINIVKQNMGIQLALAEHFVDAERPDAKDYSHSSYLYLPDPAPEIIHAATVFFTNVFVCAGSFAAALQVCGISEKGLQIFKALEISGGLNGFIRHLVLKRPAAKDSALSAVLKYYDEEAKTPDPELKDDSFVAYLEKTSRFSSNLFIPVSGFTLEELNGDEMIRALHPFFSSLYLLTSFYKDKEAHDSGKEADYLKLLSFYNSEA